MSAAYPYFTPAHEAQNDGTALGWISCTCATGSVLEDGNTFGHDHLPWRQIRNATGDFDGGTTFDQVDAAIAKLTGADRLSTGYYSRDEVLHGLDVDGKAFGMAVQYGPVLRAGQKLLAAHQPNTISGTESGFGEHPNDYHAIALVPRLAVDQTIVVPGVDAFGTAYTKALTGPGRPAYDPLCDGRRHTVARGVVLYPDELVDELFAGSVLWRGRVYGSFTLPWLIPAVPQPPEVSYRFGAVPLYRGIWRVLKPVAFRSGPWIHGFDPTDNIVSTAKAGERFHVYQALTKPNGRTFLGNRTGDKWTLLNHNRIEAVR